MGYAITPDNHLEEDLVLSVSGRCALCGTVTSETSQAWVTAGRIGIAELVEAAATRADGAAGCEHPVSGLTGLVSSRYKLPGSGRWIGANLELAGGRVTLRLASVDGGSLESRVPSVVPAGTDDYELATALGQPASVAAAWHGALLASRLGYHADFHCGPHLRLLVARDLESALIRAETLGSDCAPVAVADCGAASAHLSASAWLGDAGRAGWLWALADSRGLAGELIDEARGHGLGVQTIEGRLRLTARSELLFEDLDLGPVVERALAHARHPRVEAAYDLLAIRSRLTRRTEVLQVLLRQLEPEAWRMAGDGRSVILRKGEVETTLDLSQLAVATPRSLPGLLRSVLTEGEIPGEPGAVS